MTTTRKTTGDLPDTLLPTTRKTTRDLPDSTLLPGHQYTLGEQRETLRKMREINAAFYAMVFSAGMGSRCHAFVEFCGLQAKFIDLCQEALDQGVEFAFANQHSALPWPIDRHHADYLGEKFHCIYGFALGADPALRRAFLNAGLGKP